jgi:hypothetical protein
MQNGYYYATFQSVVMSCYNATSAPGTNTGTSYTYNNVAGTNNTVVDGDKPTVLKSFADTGLDMNAGGSSSTSGSSQATNTPESIPGLSGGSPGTNPDASGSASSAPASSTSSSGSGSGSGSGSSSGSGSGTGFSQGQSGSGSSSSGSSINQERVLKGSVFAAIVAVVGMLAL